MLEGELLAKQFDKQGIRCEKTTGVLWCSICTSEANLAIVGMTKRDILDHCATMKHLVVIEDRFPLEQHCPVEINGRRMLLDHHIVYPSVLFGKGRLLLDETLGMVIAEDVCGGVKLFPHHKYTVVEFVLPHCSSAMPCEDFHSGRPARGSSWRVCSSTIIAQCNKLIKSEIKLGKRRRAASVSVDF